MAIALALSGGGFRATLFHLGVVEYLASSHRLGDVAVIASTSGGSILAVHLLCRWNAYNDVTTFVDTAREIEDFVKLDVRGDIMRRTPWIWCSHVLPKRLFPRWRWTSVHRLMRLYDRHLYHGALLSQLPSVPRLAIVSTNLSDAALTLFSQTGIEHVVLDPTRTPRQVEAGLVTASLAVAASSAFPAFFPPMLVTHDDAGAPEGTPDAWFTDGGVTDNLALKAVGHIARDETYEIVASDAGRSFEPATVQPFGFVRTALRSSDLMMYRMREMELIRARGRDDVRLISISDSIAAASAAPKPVQQQLESIRTDLDAFSQTEIDELRRHGFWCAWKALGRPGEPMPVRLAETGHGAVATVAVVLRAGRHRRLLGALMSPHDWVSWVNFGLAATLVVAAIIVAPWFRDRVLRGYRELVRAPIPEYSRREPPAVEIVDNLTRSTNEGFAVVREDRVWDLRRLTAGGAGEALEVLGPAVMTRTMTLMREDPAVRHYSFWFETSGDKFTAWTVDDMFPLVLRTQKNRVVNGASLLKPWDLQVDVGHEPPGKEFQLRIQSETVNGFRTHANWWIGMSVASKVGTASMRIIFPENLPFRNPTFLRYPIGSANDAETFDGVVLTALGEQELLWTVDRPVIGYIYRVNWRW